MSGELVLDLETKKSFQEVGGARNMQLLGVSVVGVYDYASDIFRAFTEDEFAELEQLLRNTSRVIGFNSKHFDFPVLQPHVSVNLKTVEHLDLMESIEAHLGFRVSLDNLAKMTLGTAKSGHGMDAIEWWRAGNIDAIKKYCLDDVRITRDLYEYGKTHGSVAFEPRNAPGSAEAIPVAWGVQDHAREAQQSLF